MTYVIHVASPFPLSNPKREDEVIKPAVEGTLSVLRACVKAGTVKRVVLTSSCAAVDWTPQTHDRPRDESSWSDVTKQDPYSKSKTLAEKAAWDFMAQLPEKVLVTGASGYLAGHVVKRLQEEGHEVRGTVRSLKNENKVRHLYSLCPNAAYKLQLVEADLNDPESWERAVSGMTYVIHVASPFPLSNPKREDEVIKPAVEGTLSVLRACVKAGTVKRVVLTSSCAAVDWTPQTHDRPRDESSWSDVTKQDPYSKSKTLAEKAAWDFMAQLPEGQKFELAVINPSLIMGPPLQGSSCTSVEVLQKLLERQMPMLPRINFPMVDVRDVAEAHVRAMTLPEAAGKRHICNNTNMWFSEMGVLLRAVFGPQGYNVPTSVAPKAILRVVSLFDSSVKKILPEVGTVHLFDNARMRHVLKIEPREIRDTLVEMAYSLIEAGFVKKTNKYRGPGGPEEREMYMNLRLS